jgi:long-chain acyl-CoA synthetase
MTSPRSLIEYLLKHALHSPQRAAFLDARQTADLPKPMWKSWSEMVAETSAVADWLVTRRLGPGSIVASILPNSTAWIILDLACQTIGAIHAPVDSRYPIPLIKTLLELVKPELMVAYQSNSFHPTIAGVGPTVSWDEIEQVIATYQQNSANDHIAKLAQLYERYQAKRSNYDTATILLTSGTTDTPKGVMLSQHNLVSNAMGKLQAMPQSASDRRLNFLPFSHSYARTCELSTWLITGGELILAGGMKDMVPVAQAYSPTLINGVPIFYDGLRTALTDHQKERSVRDYLGGAIRQLASGGAALNHDTAAYFESAQLPILVGYGLTEASPVVCSNLSSDGCTDNVGPPIPGVSVRVDDQGELWVSGDGVMQGYFDNPSATAEAIYQGELRTGDLAEIDSQGRVRLVGRVRDTLVLSSGVKVAPYQVEKQLKSVAGIEDVVVVGDGWERCAAIVVLSPKLWNPLLQTSRSYQLEFISRLQAVLDALPRYASPLAWVFRQNSFASNPNLVNFKGAPRRDLIRLQYESVLRESIRSGTWSIYVDSEIEPSQHSCISE